MACPLPPALPQRCSLAGGCSAHSAGWLCFKCRCILNRFKSGKELSGLKFPVWLSELAPTPASGSAGQGPAATTRRRPQALGGSVMTVTTELITSVL